MAHIVLIACASKKQEIPARARDLYLSALFVKSLAYADRVRPDRIYILSAKHGLLPEDVVVAPYDETLNTKTAADVRAWAQSVLSDLRRETDVERDRFTILAGATYRKHLVPHLAHTSVPLEGLPIGKQLQRLGELCRPGADDPSRIVRVLAAVIVRDDRYLICQRPAEKRHGSLWEFPGGKIEAGENDFEAAVREMREELDVMVESVGAPLFTRQDEGSVFSIEFMPVEIRGTPQEIEHTAHAWVRPDQLLEYALAPSDRAFVQERLPPYAQRVGRS